MPVVSKSKTKNDINEEDDESLSASNFVPLKNANKNKKPAIEYNDRTEQSYVKQGLMPVETLNQQEKNFLSKVDPNVEPIVRTVTKIVRLKAIDYNSPKREMKEFLYYYENWTGRDWLKRTVSPCTDHVEGRYDEVLTEPVYQQQELIGHKFSGKRQVYYIPFSKSKVDEIIASSMGSDKSTIKFLFSQEPLGYEFSYDTFVNSSYEELATMLIAPGGPKTILQKQKDQQQISEMLTSTSTSAKQK
jgi:hypothetical protein